MKKKITAVLLAVIMCFALVVCVSAETKMYVVENEGNVSDEDWKSAEIIAEEIEDKYGICVMFAITSDVSKSGNTTDYCRDIYRASTDVKDGVIFTHNIKEGKYSYYTFGSVEDDYSEDVLLTMWDAYDKSDTYGEGLIAYYKAAEKLFEGNNSNAAPPANADTEDETAKTESVETTKFVSVDKEHSLVVDKADLLTSEQETDYISRLQTYAETYKSEISIVTVTDLEGKTARDYADDFYDYNGYGYGANDDGMLLLYKDGAEGEREICITTHGSGIGDYSWSEFEEPIKLKLAEGDFTGAFDTYIQLAEAAHEKSVSPMWILLSIVFGMLIGIAVPKIMVSGNKNVRPQPNASVYARPGSMVITGSSEMFVNSEVTRVAKPKDNDDNDTHTSSSGRSHGGGSSGF